MATIKELQEKIAKLEKGINSKATNPTAKAKARLLVKKFKSDISDLKAKSKPTSSKVSKAKEISKEIKRKYSKSRPFGKSDIYQDAVRPAKRIGKRTSAEGNTYYEYRENRTDRKQPPKRYPRLEDGGAIDLLSDTSGVGLQNVGGTSFSNVDLTPQMDITNPMFAHGGETHRGEGGMYAKGGRTSKNYMGRKTKQQFGKYDLSEMYENNLDLIADVVDYIKDLQKEIGQSYAKDFVYEMMDVLKEGKITYNDGATLTFDKGGRTM